MTPEQRMEEYINTIDEALDRFLPDIDMPQKKLLDAMRYSLFSGGKRLRPVMLMEFCRISGGDPADAVPFACALEMIHTYSLIHDDLPCMDNDDTRRGKPTCHIVYGEATALLAGSALLSAAFEIMLAHTRGLSEAKVLQASHIIARASGLHGIAGGQELDLFHANLSTDVVRTIHERKTARMFAAAAVTGCIAADAAPEQTEAAAAFGNLFGLGFQLADDFADAAGGDVCLLGANASREAAKISLNEALERLAAFRDPDLLIWLTNRLLKELDG